MAAWSLEPEVKTWVWVSSQQILCQPSTAAIFSRCLFCFGLAVIFLLQTFPFPSFSSQVHPSFIGPKNRVPQLGDIFKYFLPQPNLFFLFLNITSGLHLVVNPLNSHPWRLDYRLWQWYADLLQNILDLLSSPHSLLRMYQVVDLATP